MPNVVIGFTATRWRYCDRVDAPDDAAATLRALAALDDPSRRRLYEVVRSAKVPLTREQAAVAVGISRKLAAFHLDKLVAAGLLEAGYDPARRPHALGRPPKTYRPSTLHVRISIPERRPEALAELLLDAIASARPGESPKSAALRAAGEAGRRVGTGVRDEDRPGRLGAERALTVAATVLRARGFEPTRESSTCVRLLNCPFRPLTEHAADLVCGVNERFMTGLLNGLEARTVQAVLTPGPDRCCIELRALT